MSYHLFLDDLRLPNKVNWVPLPENVEWIVAKSYIEFGKIIGVRGIPKFVTYDCDLCDEHYLSYFQDRENYVTKYKQFQTKCGIHCIELMITMCSYRSIPHPTYAIHTKNHYVESYMTELIESYNYQYERRTP